MAPVPKLCVSGVGRGPSAQKPKGGGGKGRSTTSSVYRKLPSTSTASPPYRASSNFVISLPSQSLTVASSASLPPASPPTSPHALQDPFPPPRLTIEQELPQKEEEQEEEIRQTLDEANIGLLMAERERRDKWATTHPTSPLVPASNLSSSFSANSSLAVCPSSPPSSFMNSVLTVASSSFEDDDREDWEQGSDTLSRLPDSFPRNHQLPGQRDGTISAATSQTGRISYLHDIRNSDDGQSVASSGGNNMGGGPEAKARSRLVELRKAHLLSRGKSSDLKGWFEKFLDDEQADKAAAEAALDSEQQLMKMIRDAPWSTNGKMSEVVNMLLKNQSAVFDIKKFLTRLADPNHFSNLHIKKPLKSIGNIAFRDTCVKKGVVKEDIRNDFDPEMTEELKHILSQFTTQNPSVHYWKEDTRRWLRNKGKHMQHQLTPTQLKEMDKLFKAIDHDKGGGLELSELETALKVSGFGKLAHKAAKEMFDKLHIPHDGTISFREFVFVFISASQQKAQRHLTLERKHKKTRIGRSNAQMVKESSAVEDLLHDSGGVSYAIRAYQRERLLAEVNKNVQLK